MPTMTPEIHLLLASFGYPRLRLIHPAQMASIDRKRGILHHNLGHKETNMLKREWRFRLSLNAIERAKQWLNQK